MAIHIKNIIATNEANGTIFVSIMVNKRWEILIEMYLIAKKIFLRCDCNSAVTLNTQTFSEIMTIQEKAQLWLAEFKLVTIVQQNFQNVYQKDLPSVNSIKHLCQQFQETWSVDIQETPGRPRTSDENVELIHQSIVRSPKKSIAERSFQLIMIVLSVMRLLQRFLLTFMMTWGI